MPDRCHKCGGLMVHEARPGRTTRYKALVLPIPADLKLWECQGCGVLSIGKADVEIIDKATREQYERELTRRAKALIEGLATYRTQWSIEWLLGLSHGYLSKLKSGHKVPSTGLVSTLALLSADPEARFAELESFWGTGDLDERYREMAEEWRRDEEGAYHDPKE